MLKTVKELRRERGLTATFVAKQIGMKTYLYLRRENDQVEWKANELKLVANVLNVPVDQILT